MNWAIAATVLDKGLDTLAMQVAGSRRDALLDFLRLLEKWNHAFNLTAVREPEKMVTYHILDSLAIAPYLVGRRIVDVGTGPGLPGIPLAIFCPDREFVLLDSNAKKTRFITQAITELRLANVTVERSRAEDYQPTVLFDTVVSRAFASLAEMLDMTQHLCANGGVFLAMKGVYPTEELAAVPVQFTVVDVLPVVVPGLSAQRHVVRLRRTGG